MTGSLRPPEIIKSVDYFLFQFKEELKLVPLNFYLNDSMGNALGT